MEQTLQKGVSKEEDEETKLSLLISPKEVEHFVQCGQYIGKDNVLFFGDADTKNKVFLLLHGGKNGKVLFNGTLMSLQDVYYCLRKENVFDILKPLDVKCLYVLCCHSYYQQSYEEDGLTIKPYFNNKGRLFGEQLSSTEFCFRTEESLVS